MASADELKGKIDAVGGAIRQLKADKAAAPAIQEEVSRLLALKTEYKTLTGEDYLPPPPPSSGGKKDKKAAAPAPPAKEGPSKTELKKVEKKAKKTEAKAQAKQEQNGGATAEGGAIKPPSAPAATGPAKAAVAKVGEPTLYSGDDSEVIHTVLAIAQAAGVKLARGHGSKASFFGSTGPYLELPTGQVVSGLPGVVRAVALLYAPELSPARAGVDDWIEWGFNKLSKHDDVSSSSLSKEISVLEKALSKGQPYLLGQKLTLADLVLAPQAKRALSSVQEKEYPKTRAWVASIYDGEAYKASASLLTGLFNGAGGGEVNVDPRQGLLTVVQALFESAITKAFPSYVGKQKGFGVAEVHKCTNLQHGDYQCNNPMGIYKALKASGEQNAPAKPQDVAKAVIANLPPSAKEILEEVSVAGAGFINVRIRSSYLKARIRDVLDHGPQAVPAKKLKVLVDFSSPNIAKEMHVGHLRSTIIGDTICRMLEFMGHDVHRINHVGDWGTQFGMLINYLKEEYPDFMSNPPNITDLTTFYKNAKQRFDESPEFKDRARTGVVELQSGNPESRAIWKLLCVISRKEFQKVYDRLEVKLDEYGESYYNDMIPSTLEELREKGCLVVDEGATLMWCGGKHQIPLMVRKSDGGYGYDSTDLAAIRHRIKNLERDWVIYITDAGQANHFYLIFDAARIAGWVNEDDHRLDHVGFGVVQGEDGKRFKTRSGDTVRLVDLLDEAVERMTASLTDRIKEGKSSLNEQEAKEAASALGYGAVKYADLKQNPASDYQFSYDRMLDTRGDTAIYLLFTCARFHSILRKAEEEKGINLKELVATRDIILEHPTERALAFELAQFQESLAAGVNELMPNRLCSYVYNLSGKGTDFLEACHVLTNPDRLLLVQATSLVIAQSLKLLGIRPLVKI